MIKTHTTAVLALFIGFQAPEVAACELALVRVDRSAADSFVVSYDAFGPVTRSLPLTVEMERVDRAPAATTLPAGSADADMPAADASPVEPIVPADTGCDGVLAISSGAAFVHDTDGTRLPFRITSSDPGVTRDRDTVYRVADAIEPGDRVRLTYFVQMETDRIAPVGNYSVAMEVSATARGSSSAGMPVRVARATAVIGARVEAAARISLAGTLGAERIVDFGTLSDGARPVLPTSLDILSNGPYRLRFTSENDGALQIVDATRRDRVTYAASVAGRSIDLTRGAYETRFDTATDSLRNSLALDFVITDASDRPAGVYKDRLTIQILPVNLYDE